MTILGTSCRSGLHLYDLPPLFIGTLSQSASHPDAKHAHEKHQRTAAPHAPCRPVWYCNTACGLHSSPLCQHGDTQNICPENLIIKDFTHLKTAYSPKHCPLHKFHRKLRYNTLPGICVAASISLFTPKCVRDQLHLEVTKVILN